METEMEQPKIEEEMSKVSESTTPESNETNISNIKNENDDSPQTSETEKSDFSESSPVEDTSNEEAGKSSESEQTGENKMRKIEVEKMVLHCGGIEEKHEKGLKLLEMITGSKKIFVVQSKKRYPTFGIAPGKKSGCKITIRDKEKIKDLLTRFFSAVDNEISKKAISENQFCFGIHEYIEVPGLEYDRNIGILGFEVMLVFKRKGKSVKMKKIKRGSYPKKQEVTKEEILDYLVKNFGLEVKSK